MQNKMKKLVKPDWHTLWKLMRITSGYKGWVTTLAIDPSNKVNAFLIKFLVILKEN
jgi:hypothetical protein